jgi:hypothetical protein
VSERLGIRAGADLGQQQRGVLVPARIRACEVAAPRASAVRGDQEVGVLDGEVEDRVEEGAETLSRGGSRPERRLAVDDGLLELALTVVQQRKREPGAVAEAVEDGSLADARGARDLLHRHVRHAALGEQAPRRGEDLLAVARGVRAFAARGAEHGELARPGGLVGAGRIHPRGL